MKSPRKALLLRFKYLTGLKYITFPYGFMALTALASLAQHWLDFDTQFTLWVNSLHCSFCDVFMPLFSARFSWVPFYVGLAYLIVRNFTWRTALLLLLAVALLITACDQVSSAVLRPLIERLRPCDFDNPIHDAVLVVDDYRPQSYSCPSAHAANTWALTFFICWLFRHRWLTVVMFVWAFVTCYSRLYLGVHYFGDVMAGMLVGFVFSAVGCWCLSRWGNVERPNPVAHVFVPLCLFGCTTLVMLVMAVLQA